MIVQRNADFGPYTRAGDDGSKIESMTVERKITSRHGVDSRPLSEWLRDAWRAAAGVRRFPLRRLAGAELSATAKRCSRAYPPGRPVLHAVIEIIALPADSTAITLVPRARS